MITFSTAYRVQGGKYVETVDAHGNVSVNKKRILGGKYVKIGEGSAALKADAQQNAATAALETLNKHDWFKPVPAVYQKFNKGDDVKDDEVLSKESVQKMWGNDMNALQTTKEKSKYQSKYQSTPLAMYTRIRNASGVRTCLSLGADPNVQDSEGMYPSDLLFIGKTDEEAVQEILSLMFKKGILKMTRQVFEVYYTGYIGDYFGTIVDKLVLVE